MSEHFTTNQRRALEFLATSGPSTFDDVARALCTTQRRRGHVSTTLTSLAKRGFVRGGYGRFGGAPATWELTDAGRRHR